MSATKRLLNSFEATKKLNLKNSQTLANWRHNRKGPNYVKIGRFIMYEESELDRFIEANRVVLDA